MPSGKIREIGPYFGKPVPQPDLPALATAQFEFVHNVRLPGMLHGRVVRPPAVGATLINIDESSVKDLPGGVKVVVKKNFVGVVAQKPWQAIQAAAKLRVDWSPGTGLPSHQNFYEHLRKQKPVRDTLLVDSRNIEEKLMARRRPSSKLRTCIPTRCTGRSAAPAQSLTSVATRPQSGLLPRPSGISAALLRCCSV